MDTNTSNNDPATSIENSVDQTEYVCVNTNIPVEDNASSGSDTVNENKDPVVDDVDDKIDSDEQVDEKDEKKIDEEMLKNFTKIIRDFTKDLLITFPELKENLNAHLEEILTNDTPNEHSVEAIYKHCLAVFPVKFFDILYQNDSLFEDKEKLDFLPELDFRVLWKENISDKTRDSIWRYLQLTLFTIVSGINSSQSFGDTAKLFEAIDEDAFKKKLEDTISEMQESFSNMANNFDDDDNDDNEDEDDDDKKDSTKKNPFDFSSGSIPNPKDLHEHMSGMLEGKKGNLSKEIAEETANDLNLNINAPASGTDVFQKLFKNPTKLLSLIKKVGGKLDDKIKSGEIKESELLEEASDMIKKMKNMPGMGNIQNILKNMGFNPRGKVDEKMMQTQLDKSIRTAKQRDRMREKLARKQQMKQEYDIQKARMDARVPPIPEEDVIFKAALDNTTTKETLSMVDMPTTAKKKRRRKKKK